MSDLDDEEIKATRILNGVDKENNNIEKDVERCKQLIRVEHANWIGISNQLAIKHILEELKQDKKRIKELEEENGILEFQNKQVENYVKELKKYNKTVSDRIVEYKKNSIPKQKVKDKIEELKKHYNTDNNIRIYTLKDSYELQATVLEELLEEDKQ